MSRIFEKIFVSFVILVTLIATPGVIPVDGSANFGPLIAHAATFNEQVNYQGKLTNNANVAVTDGVYNMRFALYTTDTGGTAIWNEDRSTAPGDRVAVTNGLFSVMLGSSTPLTSVDFNQTLYLGVEIGGSGGSPVWDGEMAPRKVLGAVPAAFVANTLNGLDSTQFLRSDVVNPVAQFTNATTTNSTTTNLYSSSLIAGNSTSTNFYTTTASTTNLFFTGATGGTLTGSFLTSTNILATGSTTLQNFTGLNSTTTNATTTSIYTATLGLGAGNYFTSLLGSGLSNNAGALTCNSATSLVFGCLATADWQNFNNKISSSSLSGSSVINYTPGTGVITTQGGTFGAGNYVFPSGLTITTTATTTNLVALGSTTLQNFTFTNATGTSATTTNFFATTGTFGSINSNGLFTTANLLVNGSSTLQNFTGVNSTTTNSTSTNVYATTASTTNLNYTTANGGNETLAGKLTAANILANGSSTLQNFTGVNSTTTNSTSTNFYATTASTTNLFSTTGNIGTLTAGPITGGLYNGQTISSTANFTGTVTITGGLTTLSNVQVNGSSTLQNFTGLNSTTSNATTTSIYTATLGLGAGNYFTSLLGSGLSNNAGALTCNSATSLVFGCLATADWTNFNNKISSSSLSGATVINYTPGTGVITTVGGTFGAGNYIFPGQLQVNSSTTLQNFTGLNSTTTNSTSTSFAISGIVSGKLLKTTTGGAVVAALAGADYLTSAFQNWNIVNGYLTPTSTIGILVNASSTIGNGTQTGGLTVSGGATTTGSLYVGGKIGVGTQSPAQTLDVVGTGKFSSTLTLTNVPTCTGSQALQTNGSGDVACGNIAISGASTGGGWSTDNIGHVTLATSSDAVGIGATTTPYAKLSVISSTAASTTLALLPASAATGNILDIYNTSGVLTSVFTASQRLGIGTTNPNVSLDVNGQGNLNNLQITGSSTIQNFTGVNSTTTNATTTSIYTATLGLGAGNYFTSLLGSGLNNNAGALTCNSATSLVFGCLATADWQNFNNKISSSSLSGSSVINYTPGTGVITTQGGTFGAGNYVFPSGLTITTTATTTNLVALGSTTLQNFTFTNATGTSATTTNLYTSGQTILAGAGGNVGIGTTSPSANLAVAGNGYFTGGIGVGRTNSLAGSIETTGNIGVGTDSGSSATLLIRKLVNCNSGSQTLQTDGSGGIICGSVTAIGGTSAGGWTWVTPMFVQLATSTDLVGIGTSPSYSSAKLNISSGSISTTTLSLNAVSGQTSNILAVYDNNLLLSSVISASGNFGIGTANPNFKLEVNGTASTTALYATNATTTSIYTATLGLGAGNYFTSLLGSGLSNNAGALTCNTATSLVFGCLATADWTNFNNKISSSSLSGATVINYTPGTGVITTVGGTFGAGNYIFPGQLQVNSSTTLQNFTGLNSTTTNATTTNLYATAATFGSINSNGLFTTTNLLVTGSSTLQNFTALNSTSSNATTTNIYSTTASSTNLYSTNHITGTLVSNTIQANGSTTLQNFTGVNSTTTNSTSTIFYASNLVAGNATTTNFYATTASTTNLYFTSGTGNLTGNITGSAPAGLLTGTTLASNVVTSSLTTIGTLIAGAVPASLVTAGTFGTGNYIFPAQLQINSSTTLQNFTALNSTSSNATSTNFFATTGTFTNLFGSTLNLTNLLVTGSSTLQNFTGVNSTTTNSTSTNVYATTASSTNLYSTNHITGTLVSNTIQANGSTTLQNFTGVNSTTTNSTSTNFFATTASTTNLYFTSGTGNLTGNLTGNITGSAPAGSLTGTTLASNVVTSSLTTIGTLIAGAVPASLITAGTFGAGNYIFPGQLQINSSTTLQNFTGLNSTTTNATSTNLFATNIFGTNSNSTNLIFGTATGTSATTTNFYSGTASSTNLYFTSGTGGLFTANSLTGINILATGSSTLQNFTFINATGTSATTTNFFATTGTFTNLFGSTLNLTNLLVTGSSTLQNFTGLNSTTTNSTSTNVYATTASSTNLYSTNHITGTLVSNTIQANGSTTLQNFTGVNSTTSNSTSTNFFATTASTTNLYFTSGTGNLTGNLTGNITGSAPAGSLTGTTLASNVVTSSITTIGTLIAGAVPASLVTAGTFGAGNYVFPGQLQINSSTTLQNFTGLNSTTTNATSTNLYATLATFGSINSNGLFTTANLLVTGSTTLQNFTGVNSTTTNSTSTNVYATSASTTNLSYTTANGGNETLTGKLTATNIQANGSSTLQNFTGLNSTTTNSTSTNLYSSSLIAGNATTTNFFATNASTTNLYFTSGTGNLTGNLTGNITGSAPAGLLTGTTLASNVVTSSLTTIGTLIAGAVPASLITAGTFGAGNYIFPGQLQINSSTTLQNFTGLNSTSSNATSTNFFATTGTFGSINSNGLFTTANLLVTGSTTLQNFTANNSTTTNATTTNNLNVGNILTVSGAGTSTFANGIQLNGGCYLYNGTCLGGTTVTHWNDLIDPTSDLNLNMGTHVTDFNWSTGSGALDLFTLSTDISDNGTGALLLLNVGAGSNIMPLHAVVGNTEALAIDSTGRVGIGTTGPTNKLSVVGNSDISGTLTVGGLGTFNGILSYASSTIGDSTQGGGLTIFGGATTTGNYLVLGSTTLQNFTFKNATGTGATTTNFFSTNGTFTNLFGSTLSLTNLLVTGSTTLQNFTFTNATGTGATTTNFFATTLFSTTHYNSGLGTFGNILALGSTTLQNFTALNSTSSNATTTNFFATTASTTNLFATNFYGGALTSCTAGNHLLWSAGSFSCVADTIVTPNSKWATSSTDTLAIYPNSANRVGIGTTSPWANLSVSSTTQSAGSMPLFVIASTTNATLFSVLGSGLVGINTSSEDDMLAIKGNGVNNLFEAYNNNGVSTFVIQNNGNVGIGTTTPFGSLSVSDFNGGATPQFVVASSTGSGATTTAFIVNQYGNVGIGTAIPAALFEVSMTTAAGDTSGVKEIARFSRVGANAVAGSRAGLISFFDGTNNTLTAAVGGVRQNAGVDYNGALSFYTNNTGAYPTTAVSQLTEQMRITSAGLVGIGTTSPFAKLSIAAVGGDLNTTLFAIGSSTAAFATTTLFSINNVGVLNLNPYQPTGESIMTLAGQTFIQASSTTSNTTVGIGAGNALIATSTSNTSGQENTALGYHALLVATSSDSNTAIGSFALANVVAGSNSWNGADNTAVGDSAGGAISTGFNNSLFGASAGLNLTGSDNLLLGRSAGRSLTTGSYNVAIGNYVDLPNNTGNSQLNIGNVLYGTNMYQGDGTNSSAPVTNGNIGIGSTTPFAKLSISANNGDTNSLLFGIASSTAAFATTSLFSISNVGLVTATNILLTGSTTLQNFTAVNSTTSGAAVVFSGLAASTTMGMSVCWGNAPGSVGLLTHSASPNIGCGIANASSRRYKQDINPLTSSSGLAEVMALTPVSYQYTPQFLGGSVNDPNVNGTFVGFIAEDVQQIDPRLITVDSGGLPNGVQYEHMSAVLAKAIQEQQAQIASTTDLFNLQFGTATASLAGLLTNDASTTASLAGLQTSDASALTSIAGLQANIASTTASLLGLQTSNASALTSIQGLQDNVASVLASVEGLQSTYDSLAQSFSTTTSLLNSHIDFSQATTSIFGQGLTVEGQTILNGGLVVNSIGDASTTIALISDTTFFGRPYFTSDTGGTATVLNGSRRVSVVFDRPYLAEPIVSATIALDNSTTSPVDLTAKEEMIFSSGIEYLVTDKTANGFTILLSKTAPEDISFSWLALAIKDQKLAISTVFEPIATSSPATTTELSRLNLDNSTTTASTTPFVVTPPIDTSSPAQNSGGSLGGQATTELSRLNLDISPTTASTTPPAVTPPVDTSGGTDGVATSTP